MKILIFSWRDIRHPGWGGAEICTYELAKRWVKKGHKVTLVAARFPGGKSQETIDQVKILRPVIFYYQSAPEYFTYLYKTAQFYKKNLAGQYDLIIDQVHGLPLFIPLYAIKEKVILFPHEVAGRIWFYEVRFPFSLAGFFLELAYIKLFGRIPFLTVSASTAKDLKKLGVKNISIFTSGLNLKPLAKMPFKNEFPQLLSLGRITKMKRVEHTLQAFRLLHKEFPLIKLVVAGHGKEKYIERLKNLCQMMGVDDRVSFPGLVMGKEKSKLFSRSWIFVSSTAKEGWGLTPVEAAACGTPTVAYKVPGLVDSVRDKKTGLLCQKTTPVELARNIRKILLDDNLRKRLSENALEYSRQFSWDKAADEALAAIEKIISI